MTGAVPPALDHIGFADLLSRFYARLDAREMLREALTRDLKGRIALVSSFGAESVALLHLAAEIDPATPVLFLHTELLFPETLKYQKRVAHHLGLVDVRLIRPDEADVAASDPDASDPNRALRRKAPDACCALLKTAPLARALEGFEAWITGRKRAQGGRRAEMPKVELDRDGRVKLNPLAEWTPEDVAAHLRDHDLPRHPLVAEGFRSIGCAPCTTKTSPDEDPRAGRWRGVEKTECGIHLEDGKIVRGEASAAN